MSGFDKTWLTLREPVDARSRDRSLLAAAIEVIGTAAGDTILDIGCGTGSIFRMLSPGMKKLKMARQIRWRLLDDDRQLLEEAQRRHGDDVELVQGDLDRLETLPMADVGLVTASALFDLCSEHFIDRFATLISSAGIGLYATLTYDGRMDWSKSHPLDKAVVGSFNAHQQSDKGFGLALGPKAWEMLERALRKEGYAVRVAESPWVLSAADGDLQRLFIEGIIRAVREYGQLDETEICEWTDFRYRMVGRENSLCRVGHQDILAFR
ncbi:class I SAM-dependent methyltransferase [Rhizobium puerariae]|uniref:Class I SAM-dependent methyltransferase n=1 Tax=Rhizobium puerariae TaxID=1585791 RepID=A0ABV6AS29_9HYPH